jgi:hypothetical protein
MDFPMRFLLAADLHLGLRVTRFGTEVDGKVKEARLKVLDNVPKIGSDAKSDRSWRSFLYENVVLAQHRVEI